MSIPASIRRKYLSNFLAIVLTVTGLQAIAISSAPTASALTWTDVTGPTGRAKDWQHIRTSNDGSVIGVVSLGAIQGNLGDLYLSRDSGASWTYTSQPTSNYYGLYRLAISGNGNIVIAADDSYIVKANYSGSAWSYSTRTWSNPTGSGTNQRCAGYGPNFNSLASSTDGSNWVAGARDEGCVYSSSDSGANWSNANIGGTNFGSAISANGTIRVTANSNGNIYRNSGTGWSAISTSGLPASPSWGLIACDSTCTKMVIAGGGKIYRTSDSGANWSDGNAVNIYAVDISMSLDGSVIAMTNNSDIYISKDSGATWSGEGQGGKTWTGVTVSGDGTKIYAAASDGTIRKADIPPTITVACSGGGSFSVENNVVTTSTLNCAGAVVIPEGVTSIAASAFSRLSKTTQEQQRITSVTIPNSVITIGTSAFRDNQNVSSLTIGTAVTSIGDDAFNNLYGLTTLVIPGSVTTIGTRAFANVNLTSLTLNEGLVTIGNSAFLGNKLVTLVIPNSVTTISTEAAFAGWGLIETLTLGSGLTTIGNRTFEGVSRLQSLTIPPGVTTLGTDAFRDYPQSTYTYCGTSLTAAVLNSAGLTGKTKTCPVAQTITRTSTSPTSPVKSGTYTPTATASSGLTVAITIASGSASVCSISSGVVTFNTVGSCVIQYNQSGNSSYSAATQVTETLTIGKATPTFSTWSGVSKNYGDSAFTVTAPSVTGSLGGSFTYSSATTSVISVSVTTLTVVGVGSSVITATFTPTDTTNYNSATTTMTVTVGKATPTFSAWSGVSKNYGDSAFTVTAPSVTGSVPGSFIYSSATTSVISVSGTTLTVVGAGSSVITATFTPNDTTNYNSATTTMTVTVGKAVLSITASSHTVAYGAAIPTITPTYSGFVNGDASSAITAPTCSTTYTTTTAVGSAASSCTGATASNYSFAYTAGVITITQAGQTSVLAITSTTVIYGSTLSLITSGGDGGGSNSFLVNSGPCTVSGSTLTPTAVGTCMVTATKAASSNYLATSSSSTAITITPKGLTVSGLTGVNKEFDRGLAGTVTGTPTLVGVVGSDNVLLGGTPTFTFASANAGSAITLTASGYTLTGTTASNYTLTQPAVTANITAKAARVAATNTTVAFGAPVTSGVTVTGLISPDAIGSASYTYTGTGTSTPPTAVGIYTVTPSNAVLSTGTIGNYTISYDTAKVTILAKYTITYNANGGAIGSSSTTSADFVVGDNALALPTATREGFNFLGWFTLESSGVQVTGAYTPIATGTLWAHWIQKSLVGVGNSQKIGTITTLANVGNTYSATSSSGTVAVTYAANALPVGTVIDIYQMADSSRASSMISSTNNYVLSLVVAWLTPASTVPLLSVNDALTMVITDSAIKKGAKVYSLIGSEYTLLGTATADGSVTVKILEDPEVYIAITKPDAPTGVSATSGGDASSTVSWIAPSDGGSVITSYTATSNAGQTCSTATTSCSVTGLTNGTPYTFTVTATNSIGTSDPSAPSSAATPSASAARVATPAPVVTPPSSGGGGGGGGYVAPTPEPAPTVDPEVVAAAAAAAKALAEKVAMEAKLAAEAKAVADAKAAADKKAAEEAELLATLKALQEKADAEALAAAKKVADELAAAQLKAEEELKASDALKLAEEQRIAAEQSAAAKRITTVYSTSAAFKLNTTYTKRLKTNTKKIAAGSTVTCIGYAKSSKSLTYAKAKVVAAKQAKALCSSMKKINPTLKTKSTVLPASKAPKTTVNKRWIPVSYRVETAIN